MKRFFIATALFAFFAAAPSPAIVRAAAPVSSPSPSANPIVITSQAMTMTGSDTGASGTQAAAIAAAPIVISVSPMTMTGTDLGASPTVDVSVASPPITITSGAMVMTGQDPPVALKPIKLPSIGTLVPAPSPTATRNKP